MAEYYITRKQAKELGELLIKEAEAPTPDEDRFVLNPIAFVSLSTRANPIEAVTIRVINKPDIATIFVWP